MKKQIKNLLHNILSKKEFSKFWEILYKISLKGLNYGFGDNPEYSGEKSVLQLLKNNKPWHGDKYIFINVGANQGQYFHMFKRFINNYEAVLFEPSVKCYEKLQVLHNGVTQVYNLALGSEQGIANLFFDKEGSVQGSLLNTGNKSSQQVIVDTLDNVLNKDIYIDLLVIDTEGFEKNVLLGAQRLIAEKRIRMIQFEHGSDLAVLNKTFVRDFFEILHQYDIYHIKQNGIRLLKYSSEKEIFYNTNYLAILKNTL